jgi:hypothetical protein
MVSATGRQEDAVEAEFLDKVKKHLGLFNKVEKLHSSGALKGERYKKYKSSLDERTTVLRFEAIELIKQKLEGINSGILNIETMPMDVLSNSLRQSTYIEMTAKRSQLEAQKETIESCTNEEYLHFLNKEQSDRAEDD